MKPIITALFGFALLSTSLSASAADAGKKVPTTEFGRQAKDADEGSCVGAGGGAMKKGVVASVSPSWRTDTTMSISFLAPSSGLSSIEISAYRNDSAEGAAQYSVLMSAYVSQAPVTLYCTGDGTFSSTWIGAFKAP
ncbi:hypothetical protein [Bordetella bronchialis]|uniref:Phage tail protein n=1 Tax=Bordetella bronchialis TaxID=463025 RepID=A0A193FX03_9BORD|nr:hypothetical protein [Bordetella bronchialis]ANN66811.1 hypothetical protein BAU06_11425 [Bordetella bronchialis]ANN71888.1 hypothetical protein BAU08_11625 [Bordetella bronchialis]